jgi:hypothetical protein
MIKILFTVLHFFLCKEKNITAAYTNDSGVKVKEYGHFVNKHGETIHIEYARWQLIIGDKISLYITDFTFEPRGKHTWAQRMFLKLFDFIRNHGDCNMYTFENVDYDWSIKTPIGDFYAYDTERMWYMIVDYSNKFMKLNWLLSE